MKQGHYTSASSIRPRVIHPSGQQPVCFNYNLVGDNTKVYSSLADDWERTYTYDWLGRRLNYTEGELAESLTYDGGNLSTHTQSWLENGNTQTKTTHYHYTAHRLDSVGYDDALTTIYHYDQYGRVDSLYDESGVMCYEYGNMGEVTRETRIYALPFLTNALALSTQFTYDSWGRILNITYPDNEVVNYAYDLGGQLQSITNNSSYTYLDNVTYDRFGAKVSQTYGNGITTDYTYDNTTRRLSAISTTNNGSPMSNIGYLYDLVGNVTQVTSTCPWLNSQSFMESFTYDASDQLTAATEMQNQSYSLSVTYGNWGKITSYSLAQIDLQHNVTTQVSRSMTYPSNINNIGNSQTMFAPTMENGYEGVDYTFGINGSLRKREVQHPMPYTEYYLFNSAANLKAYSNNGLDFAYYGYNASNTRTYKLSFLNTNQWVNGQPEPFSLQLQSAMFYPNAYVNFNHNGEYTKHYYNGAERIASRLGNTTSQVSVTANARLTSRSSQLDNRFQEDILDLMTEGVSVSSSGGVNVSSLESPTGTASDIYYYHTNHLGSTAFVTDQNQIVTQGFLYAPFGEITTEYAPSWQNGTLPKYSFNAKELDEETGMYYYEARYYKPPVFTSRDPMFEKYFWMTPYAYCANNPVNLIDIDGKEGIVVSGGEYDGDRYKYNFIEPAIKKLKDLKEAGGSEPITWIVASAGYSESDINKFKSIAEELGVGFQIINSAKDLTNYLNSKDISSSKLSDARKKDQVTSLSVFGHGLVGSAEFAYNQSNQQIFSWDINKINNLNPGAFNNAIVDFYTCNSATNNGDIKSLGYYFSNKTYSTVTGYRGQSTYVHMNKGEGRAARRNRKTNGFNTNGSVALPKAGKNAKKIRYTTVHL